jgi:O-acetyl-ADP-ribose deacetylase (regulator of RNase III)
MRLLASCYRNSLQLACDHGMQSIAFPSISTGVYRFPIDQACRIALQTTLDMLSQGGSLERVIFTCFSDRDLDVYQDTYSQLREERG